MNRTWRQLLICFWKANHLRGDSLPYSPATRAGKYRPRPSRSGHSLHHRYLRFYLCWKRTRRLRLVIDFRIRTTAWPGLSGRATLAAERSRSRWVLVEGCPVLSVHFAFGLAPHIGQRTDNMCRNVRFSGFTPILFNIANLTDGQSCSWNFNWLQNGNLPGAGASSAGAREEEGATFVAQQQCCIRCGDFKVRHDHLVWPASALANAM